MLRLELLDDQFGLASAGGGFFRRFFEKRSFEVLNAKFVHAGKIKRDRLKIDLIGRKRATGHKISSG